MKYRELKRSLAVTSGTVLQWYDFSLFAYFAPIFSTLFFPEQSKIASTLYTFGLFSISFILAPVGSIIFGYIGDNFGRKRSLLFTILLMAISTGLIGIIPSYYQIGVAAAVLLTLCRLLQGLSASSEFTNSAVFLVEHAPSGKKNFFGSLTSFGYSMGSMLAAIVASLLTAKFMPEYAWRFSFIFAFLAGLLLFFVRRNIDETPAFNNLNLNKIPRKVSFISAFRENPRSIICTGLIAWFVGIITFGSYVFMVTYLTLYSKLSLSSAILIVSVAITLDAILEPFIAIVADKYGGKKISILGILGIILFSYPLFCLLASGSLKLIVVAMMGMSCLIAITYAPMNAFLVSLFPVGHRCSGFGVSFNLSIALLGSTVPLVMTWLIYYTNNILSPSLYYILGGLIGLLGIQLSQKIANEHFEDRMVDLPMHSISHS